METVIPSPIEESARRLGYALQTRRHLHEEVLNVNLTSGVLKTGALAFRAGLMPFSMAQRAVYQFMTPPVAFPALDLSAAEAATVGAGNGSLSPALGTSLCLVAGPASAGIGDNPRTLGNLTASLTLGTNYFTRGVLSDVRGGMGRRTDGFHYRVTVLIMAHDPGMTPVVRSSPANHAASATTVAVVCILSLSVALSAHFLDPTLPPAALTGNVLVPVAGFTKVVDIGLAPELDHQFVELLLQIIRMAFKFVLPAPFNEILHTLDIVFLETLQAFLEFSCGIRSSHNLLYFTAFDLLRHLYGAVGNLEDDLRISFHDDPTFEFPAVFEVDGIRRQGKRQKESRRDNQFIHEILLACFQPSLCLTLKRPDPRRQDTISQGAWEVNTFSN